VELLQYAMAPQKTTGSGFYSPEALPVAKPRALNVTNDNNETDNKSAAVTVFSNKDSISNHKLQRCDK